jgi:outer membrane receptor protein involved in Fe transport
LGYGVSTGGSGGIKVRGIGGQPNTDVLVLVDGLPQYAGLYGHPIADNYQTSMAERVEVIRGPASLYYGSNALGGVINIVTRQPQSDTILTRLHAQGGSFGSVDAGITHQLRRGQWTEAVGFNYVRTSGHRENMAFDQYSGFARLGYDINSHWALNATGNIAYFKTANPGTVSDPIFDSHQHILRGMATLSAENRYDRTEGAVRAYYSGGRHRINDGHKAPVPLRGEYASYCGNAARTSHSPLRRNTVAENSGPQNTGRKHHSICLAAIPFEAILPNVRLRSKGHLPRGRLRCLATVLRSHPYCVRRRCVL